MIQRIDTPTGVCFQAKGGRCCASEFMGLGWIHDMEVDSKDPTLAVRLGLRCRAWLRERGHDTFRIWIVPGSETHGAFTRTGFVIETIIMRSI